jgi:TonB-dependent SusC/RagA subfamily outer membrane receptor
MRSTLSTASLVASLALSGCRSHHPVSTIRPTRADDSVTVGYGRQARQYVTGSIASLDGDVARRGTPLDMADMIEGRFAGVQVQRLPGGGVSLLIRGQHTFLGNTEPLYVVDGVPQRIGSPGPLMDLDPYDIKSIDVLKDAGATAVYGSRGANGVILITTRGPRQ